MSVTRLDSSWLRRMTYEPGRLVFEKLDGAQMVYRQIPPWLPGLVAAGKSPGHVFNLLVRGKYPYERIPAPEPPEQDLTALLEESLRVAREGRRR